MATNGPQTPYAPEVSGFSSEDQVRFWNVLKQLREHEIATNQLPSILGNRETFEKFKQYGSKVNPLYSQFRANESKLNTLSQKSSEVETRLNGLEQSIQDSREQSISKAVKNATT